MNRTTNPVGTPPAPRTAAGSPDVGDAIALLKTMVSFPSLSTEEREIADFVASHVQSAGLSVERVDDNIYFRLGDGANCLLLNSHLDVVPPSSDSPYPPFEPTVVDGLLYGRGAVDAKACGASMTTALLSLHAEGWRPNSGSVIVALTTCEEQGGAYNGLQTLRQHLPALDAAIVGEPTDLQPCVAQKGLLILTVEARGRTAHAARAHLGENAIQNAVDDMLRLRAIEFDREHAFLGQPTITVTMLSAGTAHNVVPDSCTFTIDVRTTPAYTHEEIIETITGALSSKVSVRSKRLRPVGTETTERIVDACVSALPGTTPFGSPTASDWVFLADVPTVKLGPGSSELSHAPNEHIPVAEVVRAVDAYKKIIKGYFA